MLTSYSGTLQNFGLYQDEDVNDETKKKSRKKDLALQRLGHVNETFAAIAGFVEEDGTYLWQIVDRDPLERIRTFSDVALSYLLIDVQNRRWKTRSRRRRKPPYAAQNGARSSTSR